MISIILSTTLFMCNPVPEVSGIAYIESVYAGKYERGSKEWDRKNTEWISRDDDKPYPDDLYDVDGKGYQDSKNAADER